jgi:hypothetical protein
MMIYFWFIRHPRNGANRSHRKDCGGFCVVAQAPHASDIGLPEFGARQAAKILRADRRIPADRRAATKIENDSAA